MRVLHVLQNLSGYGAERQIRDLLPHLQADGVTAAAMTVYGSKLSDAELGSLAFPLIDIGRPRRADYTFLPRTIRAIREFKPDVVHTHTHVGKYWGRIAARAAGVRAVLHTEHNPCDTRRTSLERALDPLLHAATACVITFLSAQRAVLARTDRLPQEKIRIIANGLMPSELPDAHARKAARATLAVSQEEYAVLCIGRLEAQKNQQLALRAVAALEGDLRRRVRLFFAGGGSQEDALRELVRECGAGENVRFLGYRTDIAALLPGADMVLMSSLFEGMPLTLIEAMLAGVPIVTTPWTGACDMLENGCCGFIAPGWDETALASELSRALRSASARTAVSARAYKHASEAFDIRRTARAHRDLYAELCEGVR